MLGQKVSLSFGIGRDFITGSWASEFTSKRMGRQHFLSPCIYKYKEVGEKS